MLVLLFQSFIPYPSSIEMETRKTIYEVISNNIPSHDPVCRGFFLHCVSCGTIWFIRYLLISHRSIVKDWHHSHPGCLIASQNIEMQFKDGILLVTAYFSKLKFSARSLTVFEHIHLCMSLSLKSSGGSL
jgi:hypothetical protein